MLPVLKLAGDGQEHTSAEAVESLAQQFQLSDEERGQLLQNGQPRFNNRVGWATTYLKKAGLLQSPGRGRFEITEKGRDVLTSDPHAMDIAFLESRFPEVVEFRKGRSKTEGDGEEAPAEVNTDGTWKRREGVEDRIRQMMELTVPDEAMRVAALSFLAAAVSGGLASRSRHTRSTTDKSSCQPRGHWLAREQHDRSPRPCRVRASPPRETESRRSPLGSALRGACPSSGLGIDGV